MEYFGEQTTNNSLNPISTYHKVQRKFKEMHPNIPSQVKRGVLYIVISDLVQEESKKNEIFSEIDISEDTSIEEDYEQSAGILSGIFSKDFFKKIKDAIVSLLKLATTKDEDKMEWIIIAACILVGFPACLAYANRRNEHNKPEAKNSQKENPDLTESRLPPVMTIPAVLYLVVPASIASQFSSQQSVKIYQVKELIDTASYFLCQRGSSGSQTTLNLVHDESIDPNSQRDVCVEIKISDGKSIIGKTTRFEIKENLVDEAVYTISSIARLQNLYGLENFNRV